ncbi:DUF1963 domain-containing protein [Actinoplanes sichuanensis]|uniref:DUF1963 domain-containing protein n=1 Tax=Actinoplanes sichuanensis TaxID=512349 RepID=A0ABW4AR72_9ACTN|nr:DUF1963 domain-containing protein [Actinoplanes sichuanensis]BEL05470.1 DUF1963 domain-containing protein [Actinoplanes sichuanensis]
MDDQGRFRRAALTAGLPADEVGRFIDHLRLTVRLAGGTGDVVAGRAGGRPHLPAGRGWPSEQGGALPFVFSVDCAALPAVDGSSLPADGSLLFFLDHEQDHLTGRHGRVLHIPAGTETTAAEPPDRDLVAEEYALHATLIAELPDWLDPADEDDDEDYLSPIQKQLAEDLPHLDELRALAEEIWPRDNGLATAYLGGHVTDEVITSIAEQTLAGREKAGEIVVPVANWYSHVEREKHRLAGEWLQLAAFSTSDDLYYGSFVIRADDLVAGHLDRALSVTDFSE